jgi:hypothetical protein
MVNNVRVGGSRLGLPTSGGGVPCRTIEIFSGFRTGFVSTASHLLSLLEREGGRITSIQCFDHGLYDAGATMSDKLKALDSLPRLEGVKYSVDGGGKFHMYYEYSEGKLIEVDPKYRGQLEEKLKGTSTRFARR